MALESLSAEVAHREMRYGKLLVGLLALVANGYVFKPLEAWGMNWCVFTENAGNGGKDAVIATVRSL